MSGLKAQSVDAWLYEVDYAVLNDGNYEPGTFALEMMNFIKLVNGATGEENKTPVVHLRMLDEVEGQKSRIANLCSRGLAKTTLFFEYLAPFIGVFGGIPGFGDITGMIYVSDSMDNGVKSARKNIEFRYNNSEFLKAYLPEGKQIFTDNYIEFNNVDGHKLGIKMFGAKTGLRGTKIFGKRPVLAVLDDLVSDDDAKSPAAMQTIKDTIYKGVMYALHPTKQKVIFNGTPFNKNDILYEAVESGAWHVNVWPICERFPCTREEFKGAWEDRFTFDYVQGQYETMLKAGKIQAFQQELMLQITSAEDRLVQDEELVFYDRATLLQNKHNFNFYITTDWATSKKQTADFSAISVWAYNANGDWFWVDGIHERQTMDRSMDDLFRLVQEYKPQAVGMEVTGQQGGFLSLFQREMMTRNIWFNFAQGKGGQPGIRPVTDKLSRFHLVVPLFKAKKIFFPEHLRSKGMVAELLSQVSLATKDGLKSKHDDALDTVSQLADLNPWKPSEAAKMVEKDGLWEIDGEHEEHGSALASYVV